MDVYAKIAKQLRDFQRVGRTPLIFPCQVVSVEGNTCTVDFDGLQLSEVRLSATIDSSVEPIIITPAIGSTVVVVDLSGEMRELCVLLYSSIQSINIMGGHNGGLCITPKLVENLNKLSARVDGIIDALTNSATVAQDGGAAYKTAITTALSTLTDKEDFSAIESTSMFH
jgi:hypothetical protein